MNDGRFLSADIDPIKDTNVNQLKDRALVLIRDELNADTSLSAAASVAIISEYDGMGPDALLTQLRTFSLMLSALKNEDVYQEMLSILAALLRSGIYKVDGAAMDAILVRRDAIQVDIDGQLTLIGSMDAELLTSLSLGKESRETERQLSVIGRLVKSRTEDN